MKGQWLGTYTGSTEGNLMVNIDEVEDHYETVAYLTPSTTEIPSSVAYLSTKDKKRKQRSIAFINSVDPRTLFQVEWEKIKHLYGKDVDHSKTAKVEIEFSDNQLKIEALTDIGIQFSSILQKPPEQEESKIPGKKMSWSKFKSHISKRAKSTYLFRGQRKPWRLCTSYHRRGRYRVNEFVNKDVKQLHQRLSAITPHFFDLTQPDQNGAFFSLLQHHGYPTPLLDWSYSPYVAAFFAFRKWPIKYNSGDELARVYIFNSNEWRKKYRQIQILDPPFPHLSVMEFIAIDNPRLVPQQTVTTVTNIYDIEAYILEQEKIAGTKFIEAIDIPANNRETAMEDLRFMGITAGSMFPSIDGVCEELRELNFGK